ncbi:MAG: hypothetical protein WBW49_28045, partial [Candidatus Acidiferrum sp.]
GIGGLIRCGLGFHRCSLLARRYACLILVVLGLLPEEGSSQQASCAGYKKVIPHQFPSPRPFA